MSTGKPAVDTTSRLKPGKEDRSTLKPVVLAKAEGATVLFVEHDMEVVSRFAERVLAFYDGRIIADAAPEIALRDPEVKRYVVGGELRRMDEQRGAANA